VSFEPIQIRAGSPLHKLDRAVAADTLANLVDAVGPHGTPEERRNRVTTAIAVVETFNPGDAVEAMLAVDIVAANLGLRQNLRLAMDAGLTAAEMVRLRNSAAVLQRLVRDTMRTLKEWQADKAAKAKAAVPVAEAAVAVVAAPVVVAPVVVAEAPVLMAMPPVVPLAARQRPMCTIATLGQEYLYRPEGTRLEDPPLLWTQNHVRADGSVPYWSLEEIARMTREEKLAAWAFREPFDVFSAEAIAVTGADPRDFMDDGWAGETGVGGGCEEKLLEAPHEP
jgi:hypothetical protein